MASSFSPVPQRLQDEIEWISESRAHYEVFVDDDNIRKFVAFIYGPRHSVYRDKIMGFRFEIPDGYPEEPPRVTFLQYARKDVRMHPNFHPDGTVNLSYLKPGYSGLCWHRDLNIHHSESPILESKLDDVPHLWDVKRMHENLYQYNTYVQHQTWYLLIDYLNHEPNNDIKIWIKDFIAERAMGIVRAIRHEKDRNEVLESFYTPYGEHGYTTYEPDYMDLATKMARAIIFSRTPHEVIEID
ncbi:ubiquitin-conjugating enzyme/RWD-like protein [Xylaria sp. FL1042]|nr:ubiquitin-conjugating enzyme/RWD-like protein [Xylaria sp. FL1042]